MRNANFEATGPSDVDRILAEFDFVANVDSTLSASANWEIIKNRLGLVTQGELDELLATADQESRDRVRAEIRDEIDEFGLEAVVDAVAGNPAPDRLQERVDDVLEEFPPDVYDTTIREEVGLIFDLLGQDFSVIETDRLRELQEGAREPGVPDAAREQVLQRLSEAFGQQFDTVDEAVRTLQERMATARGERLQIAPIRARILSGGVRVDIQDGEEFEPFAELVERRVRRVIDFSGVDPPETATVGEIAIRGRGEDAAIDRVDLERGIERFGTLEGAEELPEIGPPEREQERLEELTEPNRRADRTIELLER